MYSAKMLIKILLSREAFASMSLAVGMRTVDSVLRAAVLAMNLSLMSEEAARICEARKIFTSFGRTAIRAFVLVHVLAAGRMWLALNFADSGGGGGRSGFTYFHSHLREKARTSSLQSSRGQ